MSPDRPSDREALALWLAMLAGNEPPGGYLELRLRQHARGMRRFGFYPTRDRPAIMAAVEGRARDGDMFVGVAPRRGTPDGRPPRSGGLDAIERSWVLHVDADTPAACAALRAFQPPPTCIIASGHGLHGYWALKEPLRPSHAKRANRRLAHRLGADMNATDAARIMRPPGTLNHKRRPAQPVVCEHFEIVLYAARDIVGDLPDPPAAFATVRPTAAAYRPGDGGSSRALAGLARTVAEAQPRNRNATLHWAACRAGERVLTGEVDEREAAEQLRNAAAHTGLGEAEITATIRSAFRTAAGSAGGRVAA